MKPYQRTCHCGWWHRGLRAAGFRDRHTHQCEVLHGLGFLAYVAEQRALLQQHNGGAPRYVPVSVDERDCYSRRNCPYA